MWVLSMTSIFPVLVCDIGCGIAYEGVVHPKITRIKKKIMIFVCDWKLVSNWSFGLILKLRTLKESWYLCVLEKYYRIAHLKLQVYLRKDILWQNKLGFFFSNSRQSTPLINYICVRQKLHLLQQLDVSLNKQTEVFCHHNQDPY